MHLCVVSPFPPEISGIGQYGWQVVRGLAHSGRFQALRVLAGSTPPGARRPAHGSDPVEVDYVWARDDRAAPARIIRAVRASGADLVWLNLSYTAFGAARLTNFMGLTLPALLRAGGLPTVVTLHEVFDAVSPAVLGAARNWLTRGGAHLATRLVLLADAVCVTLKRYRDHLRRWYWAGNTWHVPLYAAADAIDRPAGAPAQEILMLAAHAPHRGLPVLLEAFQHVQAVFPQATLTVAGGDHLRFPGYLAAQREASRAIPNVRWLGHQTEAQLRAAFARARVVVIPALATTGASSVVHRAVGHGRPVIASDLPDLRAVAAEERLWLEFTPPGDAAALAARLAALLRDEARTEAIVRHNLAAAQTLTPAHTAARYLEVFAHVLAARRATPADRTLALPY